MATHRKTSKKFPDNTPKDQDSSSLPMSKKEAEAAEHFVRGVLSRGEAIAAPDKELPPGVTHEIVEGENGETPKIRRRRFSAF